MSKGTDTSPEEEEDPPIEQPPTNRPLSDEMIALIERGVASLNRELAQAKAQVEMLEEDALWACEQRNKECEIRDGMVGRIKKLHIELRQIAKLADRAAPADMIDTMTEIRTIADKAVQA